MDELFDTFMEEEYDGDQGLEEEDAMIGEKIEGNTALDAAMDEFRADFRYLVPLQEAANTGQIVLDARTAQQIENDNLKPNQNPDAYVFEKEEPEWDCETVVSTYSNLENHPKILDDDLRRIRLSKKSGIALGVLPERQSKKALAALLEEEEDEEEDEEERTAAGGERATKRLKLLESTPKLPVGVDATWPLPAQVEELRKRHPQIREAWRDYCLLHGTKTEDPSRHQSAFLQKFLNSIVPFLAMIPQYPPPGPSPDQGQDPDYISLVSRVKSFRGSGAVRAEVWEKYCAVSYGGIRDPSRHTKESLQHFVMANNVFF